MINTRGGRIVVRPNNDYTDWHRLATNELRAQKPATGVEKAIVEIKFNLPDNRARDLTNMAESIMDLLVDNGILKDDSWQIVKAVTLTAEGIDKANPRAEVIIHCIK